MDVLLDTHSYLWFMEGNNLLPEKARRTITDVSIVKFISMASLWEIAIKTEINKLKLKIPFSDLEKEIQIDGFEILPIKFVHLQELMQLEFHHKDPFDRLIIAQAISEKMTVITKDENFSKYNQLKLLWQ
ncbi:MAG: type II toxin-antitoxin system VapC family toxin [Moheibacter sp.]